MIKKGYQPKMVYGKPNPNYTGPERAKSFDSSSITGVRGFLTVIWLSDNKYVIMSYDDKILLKDVVHYEIIRICQAKRCKL